MARTMYSDQITRSDAFLSMPSSTRELYFQLLSDADNDGFIDKVKSIIRMIGASADDYNLLVFKRFLIEFESGVIVIKHWRIHNLMRMDRYKPTVYQAELAMLDLKENKAYTLKEIDINLFTQEIKEISTNLGSGNQMATNGCPKISKDKISKDKEENNDAVNASLVYGEFKNVILTSEELEKLKEKTPKYTEYIENLSAYKTSSGKKYKSDYATLLNWIRKDGGGKVNERPQSDDISYVPKRERGN